MTALHHLRISRAALALGMILLELVLVGHMALERHTVSTSGAVVELHASLDLHAHEDRSLCETDGAEDALQTDADCHGTPETLSLNQRTDAREPSLELDVTSQTTDQQHAAPFALWLMAPKASPPARA
ncbi:MAG: hypothetical protein ABTQ32_29405 [Myxococcaceae bacterium]